MFALRKDGGVQKWSRFASHPSVDFFQWHSGAEGATALLASPCWAGEEKDEEARKKPFFSASAGPVATICFI